MSYTITYKVYYNQEGVLKTRTIDSDREVRYDLYSSRGSNRLQFLVGRPMNSKGYIIESTSAPIEVLSFIKHEHIMPKTGERDELKLTYVLTLPGADENVVLPYVITKEQWQEIANKGIKEGLKINVLINGVQMLYISYDDENNGGEK